jgi:hypothetical protein
MSQLPVDSVTSYIIEQYGGKEKCLAAFDRKIHAFNSMWSQQDIEVIGRVQRAHLIVEHYLAEFITHTNPKLGSIENARLTFAQKAELVGSSNVKLAMFLPGIRRLNKIRNRLAHNLSVAITEEDTAVFLSVWPFSSLRTELAKPGKPSDDALDIVEEFARRVAMDIQGELSGDNEIFRKAFEQVSVDNQHLTTE